MLLKFFLLNFHLSDCLFEVRHSAQVGTLTWVRYFSSHIGYMPKYIGYFYIFIVLFNSLFLFEFQIINKHLHCLVLQYEFYFYME